VVVEQDPPFGTQTCTWQYDSRRVQIWMIGASEKSLWPEQLGWNEYGG
jgi:hypothetical protein